jgi:hypothetical protein
MPNLPGQSIGRYQDLLSGKKVVAIFVVLTIALIAVFGVGCTNQKSAALPAITATTTLELLTATSAPPSATPESSATISPTKTPRPAPTPTLPPAWVTDFAQPILAAIANLPPNFQDDFGPGSSSWKADEWCGARMKYVDGELVIKDCRASRQNINYQDFVIEFDARVLPGAASGSQWVFHFRDIGGPTHAIHFYQNGDVLVFFYQDNSHESVLYDFPSAANPGNQSNHILVIGKGSRKAIFLNAKPLVSDEAINPSSGDFRFFADGTILAIDNIRVWNIADISGFGSPIPVKGARHEHNQNLPDVR